MCPCTVELQKKNNALTEIITKKDEYSSFNLRYDTEERKYLGTLDIRYSFILLYTRCWGYEKRQDIILARKEFISRWRKCQFVKTDTRCEYAKFYSESFYKRLWTAD